MDAHRCWSLRLLSLAALGVLACDATSPSDDTPTSPLIAFTAIGHDEEALSDVFVVALDGSNLRRLTSSPDFEGEPAWSPDGSQLVFARQHGINNDLYRIDADGTNLVRLTTGGGDHRTPDWAPDGSRILLTRDQQIATIRPDGSDFGLLGVAGEYPVWSPDGSMIAYVGWTGAGGVFQDAVFVMERDGTNSRPLTTAPDLGIWRPTWHPGGERIVYARSAPPRPGPLRLYSVNLDGSGDAPVRPDDVVSEFDPQVSSDGELLLLVRQPADASGQARLHVASAIAGTTAPVPIDLPGSHHQPAWHSPTE